MTSPRPWRVGPLGSIFDAADDSSRCVSVGSTIDDAALVVLAVNSHEELVRVVEQVRQSLEPMDPDPEQQKLLEVCRAALERAKP